MPLPDSDVIERFTFHPADEAAAHLHGLIRTSCMDLALALNEVLPPSREASLALTALQETMMWANAAVAIHGVPDGQ